MERIITGNLNQQIDLHPETKGWFIGSFMEEYPDFLNNNVELKWVRRKKNKKKYSVAPKQKTIVILISGKMIIKYPELKKEVVLSKLGDFVLYNTIKSKHETTTLKDSVFLVVRYLP